MSANSLSHLWQLAAHCAEKNPALSRFYLNEISSLCDRTSDDLSEALSLKYCQHCFELFTVKNCRVRVLPKRRKNKKQKQKNDRNEERKDCHKKKGEVFNLARKLNHVGVFCKTCGKHSFVTGQPRSAAIPVSKARNSSNTPSNQSGGNFSVLSSALQNNSMGQHSDSTNLSKSRIKRLRRKNSKLKCLLLADEKQKSASTGASPRLQDFLSAVIPVTKTVTGDSSKRPSNQSGENFFVLSSTPQNNSVDQHSTPNLSKSRIRRPGRNKSKLKGLLLADEKQKSASTGASPQLQDFLSSL